MLSFKTLNHDYVNLSVSKSANLQYGPIYNRRSKTLVVRV